MNLDTAVGMYWDENGFTDILWGEIKAAAAEHGWDKVPLNPEMTDFERYKIIMEEIMEYIRSATYDGQEKFDMDKELLQVCAMTGAAYMGRNLSPTEKEI